jgi:hypothetical protein
MPSTAFGSGLTRLLTGASQGQENQNKKNNRQNQLIEKNAFHRFPFLETQQVGCSYRTIVFYRLPGTKTRYHFFIIAAPSPAVNAKNCATQNQGPHFHPACGGFGKFNHGGPKCQTGF